MSLKSMGLPELVISVWNIPHRGCGDIIHVDSSLIEDGLPGGFLQNFQDVGKHDRLPEFDAACAYKEFTVFPETIATLAQKLDQTSYSFAEHVYTPMLGGTLYGVRVCRGYQQVSVLWQGNFADQDPGIKELYQMVRGLVNS